MGKNYIKWIKKKSPSSKIQLHRNIHYANTKKIKQFHTIMYGGNKAEILNEVKNILSKPEPKLSQMYYLPQRKHL